MRRSVPILRLEHVTKSYARRPVLNDVDLVLPSGSFHLVVGPNGSGKTTLLRLFTTTVQPSHGKVRWGRADGRELDDPAVIRSHLGYAGHTPLVYDELTVRENVEFVLEARRRDAETVRTATDGWLSTFGLTSRGDDRADTLSRGWRQRLALAQAFAPAPDFLILDEPASNLDTGGLDALLASLKGIKGTATIVVATHDPDPFRPLADHTLEVHTGTVREWGMPR